MPSLHLASSKQPRLVLENVFAFPPNRETLGATAYLIVENFANILIDCPAWDENTQAFLTERGGVDCLFLTHRGSMGKVAQVQADTGCEIIVQEQEAYLLPESEVAVFGTEVELAGNCWGFWTPGHSPGSSCFYYRGSGEGSEGVLFTGRHLLPDLQGHPAPLRTAKTFHWRRQLGSVRAILDRFSPQTLHLICPGANTGLLRGKRAIASAYDLLLQLDLDACGLAPLL
jgi:glyoxylase-like metal-dependent hydrolase (beta-lactamase superfamily II)